MTAMKAAGCGGWILQNRAACYAALIWKDHFLIIKGKIIPIAFVWDSILLLTFGLEPALSSWGFIVIWMEKNTQKKFF